MKKQIIIDEETTKNSPNKLIQKKFIEWLLYMIVYALVLITISHLFKKTFYINTKHFGIYALMASIIIYILNETIKPILVYITLPITALTYGLFYPIINVIILEITSLILQDNFKIHGIIMPIIVAVAISILNILIDQIFIRPIINKRRQV